MASHPSMPRFSRDSEEPTRPYASAEIDELDFDDEEPTQVERRIPKRSSCITPPAPQNEAVFLLTTPKPRPEPLLASVAQEMGEPGAPASMEARAHQMSSIAPVAMDAEEKAQETLPAPLQPVSHKWHGIMLGALAVVAVAVAAWPGRTRVASQQSAPALKPEAAAEVQSRAPSTASPVVTVAEVAIVAAPLGEKKAGAGVAAVGDAPVAAATSTAAEPAANAPDDAASALPAAVPEPPQAQPAAFDSAAARAALNASADNAGSCKAEGEPAGMARVLVTFAPSGRVTNSVVEGAPYAGTRTGGCIARAFRSVQVSAFTGSPVTVGMTVTIQ